MIFCIEFFRAEYGFVQAVGGEMNDRPTRQPLDTMPLLQALGVDSQ